MRIANIGWNLAGLSSPLFVAFLTIPSLIARVGIERFGLLALAWGLIGFAGLFDLGIGRATTQSISRLRGRNRVKEVSGVLATAANLSFRTGLIGAVLLGMAVLAGAQTHIRYAHELNSEVTLSAYLLTLTIPIQSVSAMFRGVNEAFENFRDISFVRIGLGVANFLGPFCVALFTANLAVLVSTLLLSRLIAFFLYRRFAKICLARELPMASPDESAEASSEAAKQLLSFGAWFTVSSVVNPFLTQADRFLIGAAISASAVATYAIPYEIAVQSLILVGAITTVMFPRLTVLIGSQPGEVMKIFYRWLLIATFMMIVVAAVLVVMLPYVLPLWIGEGLPQGAVSVGQILCLGLAPYAVGTMFVALIHAHGRSDITGKAHVLELPVFLAVLYWLTRTYGVEGAAWAWVARVSLDAIILALGFMNRKQEPRYHAGRCEQ